MRPMLRICLTLALILAAPTLSLAAPACCAAPAASQPAQACCQAPVTAVLSALNEETALLEQSLEGKQEQKIQGIRFVTGTLSGRKVVLAVSGMGKVNAAVVSTLLIEHFCPREVLFSGIAGCLNPKLGLGDIVIADRTVQHDLLTLERKHVGPMEIFSPVDGARNPEYFPADGRLLKAAQAAACRAHPATFKKDGKDRPSQITTGLVVTGDMFVGSDAKRKELQKRYHADAVEMEGAAVAQVCYQLAVPCLVIRSISDLADNAADNDVEVFMKAAANNAAGFVKEVLAEMDAPAAVTQPAAAAK